MEKKTFKLSAQAMGTFMLALQKCLAEEIDIVLILSDLEFEDTEGGLVCSNPPVVTFANTQNQDSQETK